MIDVDSLDAWRIHGIDLFDSILVDLRLGDAFQERHEQMRELLMQQRSAATRSDSDDDVGRDSPRTVDCELLVTPLPSLAA